MFVTPGEELVSIKEEEFSNDFVGDGVYSIKGENGTVILRASRVGKAASTTSTVGGQTRQRYHVAGPSGHGLEYTAPQVGQLVIGRVTRLAYDHIVIQLDLVLNGDSYGACYPGQVGWVKIVGQMETPWARVGDLVRARIVALGLHQIFYVDIYSEAQLGVIYASCPVTKDPMRVIEVENGLSWATCHVCHHREQRKWAKQ